MLLSYSDLVEVVNQGVISNVMPEQINGSSIDLTLGNVIKVELPRKNNSQPHQITLRSRRPLPMRDVDITGKKFILAPGQFILAQTEQEFYIPNYLSAEFKLKSSAARIGLEHSLAGWCDPGWNGSVLTLELKNVTQNTAIALMVGDLIGQICFFKHEDVPEEFSYAIRGHYNNDKRVSGAKPINQPL